MAIKRLYDTLIGATVNVNQLFNPTRVEYGAFPFTKNGIEFTLLDGRIILNGTATADTSALGFAKIVSGHKYYRKNLKSNPFNIFSYYPLDDESIVNATGDNEYAVMTIPNGTTVTNYKYSGMIIDLTAYFGSSIADYIYSLETATAGAGVAKLKEWGFFTGEYIPYNAGTLESVEARSHVMRGFNCTNGAWTLGNISADGTLDSTRTCARASDYFRVIPNAEYCLSTQVITAQKRIVWYDSDHNFIRRDNTNSQSTIYTATAPSNASYGLWCVNYNNSDTVTENIINSLSLCVNISSDRNGEYEPYHEYSYDLGTDTLRGLFKLDSENNLYTDGDRKASDGTITRYYGTRAYQSGDESLADAITDGTTTVYKLTTPTTEQSTPFTNPQICDPDGTEEYVTENGVPVGHETRYQL